MKVDLSKVVIGYDGEPLVDKTEGVGCKLPDDTPVYLKFGLKVKDPNGKEIELIDDRKPKVVGDLLLQLVTTPLKGDDKHSADQRTRLFELSQLFYKNKEKTVALKAEDVVELKSRALKLYIDIQVFNGVVNAIES